MSENIPHGRPLQFSESAKPLKSRKGWFSLFLIPVLLFLVSQLDAPYVIYQPGSVFNTLGEVKSSEGLVPMIQIDGAETFPTEGNLNLLTIAQRGSPDNLPSWADIVFAWFDADKDVFPVDQIFPPGVTSEDMIEQNQIQMNNSKQEAVAAALLYLGYEFDSTYTVHSLMDGSPAEGVLLPGDEIVSINGVKFSTVDQLRQALSVGGAGVPIEATILRDNSSMSVSLTPQLVDGAVVMGVYLEANYDFPIDVNILLDRVGGASAGMMFALGIIDTLTEGELTGGENISGTGTIDASGNVGPIGGEKQKLAAAAHAGSSWFLIDRQDCADLPATFPDGLRVIPVSTLAEAVETVRAIGEGQDADMFQSCPGR